MQECRRYPWSALSPAILLYPFVFGAYSLHFDTHKFTCSSRRTHTQRVREEVTLCLPFVMTSKGVEIIVHCECCECCIVKKKNECSKRCYSVPSIQLKPDGIKITKRTPNETMWQFVFSRCFWKYFRFTGITISMVLLLSNVLVLTTAPKIDKKSFGKHNADDQQCNTVCRSLCCCCCCECQSECLYNLQESTAKKNKWEWISAANARQNVLFKDWNRMQL